MRTVLDPHLVDATGREPGLWIAVRDQRRALLFDLGELGALSPRTLLRSSHAVVTHPHLDHFAGFDHWLATALGRKPGMTVGGGPGFVDRLEHKLRAYTWNVVHRYPMPLVIEARSLEADGTRRGARFDSRDAFARRDLPDDDTLDVRWRDAAGDHERRFRLGELTPRPAVASATSPTFASRRPTWCSSTRCWPASTCSTSNAYSRMPTASSRAAATT